MYVLPIISILGRLEAVGPSHWAIAAAAATAAIDTTRTLPALIQAEGLETAALYTL